MRVQIWMTWTHGIFGDFFGFFRIFFRLSSTSFLTKMMFQGDFWPNEDAWALLKYFENDIARLPVPLTEPKKCMHFSNYLYTNLQAEEWYEELKDSAPEALTSWATLCKHFHVEWLGANLNMSPHPLFAQPQWHQQQLDTTTCLITCSHPPLPLNHLTMPQIRPNHAQDHPSHHQTTSQWQEAWDGHGDHQRCNGQHEHNNAKLNEGEG